MQKEIYNDETLKSYANSKKVFIFKKLHKNASYPKKATRFASGLDLYSYYDITIPAGKCILVDIGLAVFIPNDYELQIRPRSGLSLNGIIAVFGTIDSDYSGMSLGVMLTNITDKEYYLQRNTRIAQAVRNQISQTEIFNSELELICTTDTERKGGFGSTGIS